MPLLLVSSVETVEEQEFPIASLRAPPLPFFLFLFSRSTRQPGRGGRGEYTFSSINELRGTEETRVLCPRTRLELHSKVSTRDCGKYQLACFFPFAEWSAHQVSLMYSKETSARRRRSFSRKFPLGRIAWFLWFDIGHTVIIDSNGFSTQFLYSCRYRHRDHRDILSV